MLREIDEPSLLKACTGAGESPPTRTQLKAWRRAGVIPRPRIEHRPGLKGSKAFYPAWADDQLVAVVRLHRRFHRLDDLVVAVWWEGRWVEPQALRTALIAPLEAMSEEAAAARAGADNPYDAADAILAAMKKTHGSSHATAYLRKRLSGADLMDVLWTLLVLATGGQAPWEQEDRSLPDPAPGALPLLARALGVDEPIDPLSQGSWFPEDFDLAKFMDGLRRAGGFDLDDPARPIREATDADLARAREDAYMFSSQLATIAEGLEGLLDRSVPALGALSGFSCDTSADRALMTRSVLILRDCAGDQAFVALTKLVDDCYERYAGIVALRAGLPQHQSILRADFADRVAALPAAEADRAWDEVGKFLREHPDVASALSGR